MKKYGNMVVIFILVVILSTVTLFASGCKSGDTVKDDPIITPGDDTKPGGGTDDDNKPAPEERKVTFIDDFNGDKLDSSKWEIMIGTGKAYGLDFWGNSEKQSYQAKNALVNSGALSIVAKKEDKLADDGRTIMNYTSARIRTKGKFKQTYGRFEARIKVDSVDGLWPAFWLMPENSEYGGWPASGEIDIMEIKGRLAERSSAALHYTTSSGGHTFSTREANLPSGTIDDYHVYAVEWTADYIAFYVDDEELLMVTKWLTKGKPFPAPYDKDFHIILNLAVGGHFDGHRLPPEQQLPATMMVDYVRVLEPLKN